VRIADDVHVFVLDDGGVLFAGHTQELSALNTSATFIWCSIEEGLDAGQIIAAYQGAFDVASDEAERHVVSTLANWQGLGYLTGYAIPPEGEQPLLAAVARMFIDESLRAEFERSPRALATRLGVAREGLADFLALDPVLVSEQARLMRARQARSRGEAGSGHARAFCGVCSDGRSVLAAVAGAALRDPSASAITRHYRMLGTVFCLRIGSLAQAARIEPVVAHLATDGAEAPDVILDVMDIGSGHALLVDSVPVASCDDLDQLVPLIKSSIRRIATDRHRFIFEVHAGVVAAGRHCILLPGPPGCGKSTLTAALSYAGLRYFSDEVALLEEPDFAVRPVPLSLGVKPGAVEVLGSLYPAVRDLAVHTREDEQRVRYLRPPGDRHDVQEALPVRWVVFPAYDPAAPTRLEPISRVEALRRLMGECMVLPQLLDESRVHALVRWLRTVDCMQLPLSSLSEAVELVKGRCRV
jgi:hypothetical protein